MKWQIIAWECKQCKTFEWFLHRNRASEGKGDKCSLWLFELLSVLFHLKGKKYKIKKNPFIHSFLQMVNGEQWTSEHCLSSILHKISPKNRIISIQCFARKFSPSYKFVDELRRLQFRNDYHFLLENKNEFHASYCANWLSRKQKHFQFVFSSSEFRIEFWWLSIGFDTEWNNIQYAHTLPHIHVSKYDKICYGIRMKSNKQRSAFSMFECWVSSLGIIASGVQKQKHKFLKAIQNWNTNNKRRHKQTN